MKTLLQMEMYYVREYTSTCRFLKIINSTLTVLVDYFYKCILHYVTTNIFGHTCNNVFTINTLLTVKQDLLSVSHESYSFVRWWIHDINRLV